MSLYHAVWQNGKKKLSGTWWYNWGGDYFIITTKNNRFRVYDDSPEWGNWKIIEQDGKR